MDDYFDFDYVPWYEESTSQQYAPGSEMQLQRAYAEATALVDQCKRMGLVTDGGPISLRPLIVDGDCRYVVVRCRYDPNNDDSVLCFEAIEENFPYNWDSIARQNLGI